MHVHTGALEAVKVFLMVIVIGFFWRVISGLNSQNKLGQGMAVLY